MNTIDVTEQVFTHITQKIGDLDIEVILEQTNLSYITVRESFTKGFYSLKNRRINFNTYRYKISTPNPPLELNYDSLGIIAGVLTERFFCEIQPRKILVLQRACFTFDTHPNQESSFTMIVAIE